MSDDSFIREVDEELRSDRMQQFWSRYGKIVLAVAAAVIIGTAAYRYYEYSRTAKAQANGDAFMAAIQLAETGKSDDAIAAFRALEKEASPVYKSMAGIRAASELAAKGDVAEAIKQFDAVAADSAADENMRAIARIRAGMLLVDSGSVTEVEARVGPLSAPGAPYRASAWEALGLAYYKAGDLENAFKQFEALKKDSDTPVAMRQRGTIMLDLIAANGGPISQ